MQQQQKDDVGIIISVKPPQPSHNNEAAISRKKARCTSALWISKEKTSSYQMRSVPGRSPLLGVSAAGLGARTELLVSLLSVFIGALRFCRCA